MLLKEPLASAGLIDLFISVFTFNFSIIFLFNKQRWRVNNSRANFLKYNKGNSHNYNTSLIDTYCLWFKNNDGNRVIVPKLRINRLLIKTYRVVSTLNSLNINKHFIHYFHQTKYNLSPKYNHCMGLPTHTFLKLHYRPNSGYRKSNVHNTYSYPIFLLSELTIKQISTYKIVVISDSCSIKLRLHLNNLLELSINNIVMSSTGLDCGVNLCTKYNHLSKYNLTIERMNSGPINRVIYLLLNRRINVQCIKGHYYLYFIFYNLIYSKAKQLLGSNINPCCFTLIQFYFYEPG